MQKYDIHVCLVSAQAAANLLPVVVTEFTPKEVILFITDEMKKNGNSDNLKKAFQSLGIAVYERYLTEPFDFEITENEILAELENFKGANFEDLNIALNVTGGTKVMAMAAQSIFSLAQKAVFYVNTDKNKVIFLGKNKSHNFEINAKLPLKPYLLSYGFEISEMSKKIKTQPLEIFSQFFIQNFHKNKGTIAVINAFAAYAKKNIYKFTKDSPNYDSLNHFLDELSLLDFIDCTEERINFKNDETQQFIGGSWLEHYVYQQIKDFDEINDIAMSVKLRSPDFDKNKNELAKENLGKQNELDVAFMANNKLHIIECKTLKVNEKGEDEKDDGIIYKLETLKHKMGGMAKGCLVSYSAVSTAMKNRAKEYNIEIIDAQSIQNVRSRIKQWISEGN